MAAAVLAGAALAHADLPLEEIAGGPPRRAPAPSERARLESAIRAEQEAERHREAQHLGETQAAARARAEALAGRPLPVRLLEARCTSCHEPRYYDDKTYGRLRWEFIILRMEWLNNVALDAGERALIASHLAAERPASWPRVVMEAILLVFAPPLLPLAAWVWWRRTRRG